VLNNIEHTAYLTPDEAPEPKKLLECKACDYGVCNIDEKYIDTGDGYICQSCMDNMDIEELLPHLKCEMKRVWHLVNDEQNRMD